ncbi:hypothetical protein [Leptonema illini]|uniref:Uncharacterized protein n=1 Tax=Leptonema illini DSM 21528 TaxID=929563 RepID=H2CGA8_9LEPT|nr:hypothetical protein [Leptonema illini]EHQ06823.1 hypothetical protein Lepil_2146 [Leptonema illini DSM 21528]
MKRSLLIQAGLLATILLTSSPAQAQSTKRIDLCLHLSMEIPSTWHVNDRNVSRALVDKQETDKDQTTPPSTVLNRLFDYTMTAKSAQISIPNAPEPLFVLCEYPMDAIITQHPEKLITAFLHRLPEGQMIVRPTKIKLGARMQSISPSVTGRKRAAIRQAAGIGLISGHNCLLIELR